MKRFLLIVPGALAALLASQVPARSQAPVAVPAPIDGTSTTAGSYTAFGQAPAAVPAPAMPYASVPQREVVPAPAADAHKHGSTVHAVNEKLVRDLTAILKKTKSTDTFIVTVKALADMGPRAKPAVPAIILNAERLGLLKDILQQVDDDSDDDCPGDFIVEAIAQIVASKEVRQAQRSGIPYASPDLLPPPRMVRPVITPAPTAPVPAPVCPPAFAAH